MQKEIWVLDDELTVHRLIEEIVNGLNSEYEIIVKCFFSVESVISQLIKNQPDVLLIDLELKGLDGLDLIDFLKERDSSKEIDLYVISNSIHPKDISDSMKSNLIKDYIPKPITYEDLEEVLDL